MKNLNLQAVMIDLDGTMVDTIGDFEVALNRALTDLNIPTANRALIERGIGKGSEHLIRTVLLHQLALPEVASHQHGFLGVTVLSGKNQTLYRFLKLVKLCEAVRRTP